MNVCVFHLLDLDSNSCTRSVGQQTVMSVFSAIHCYRPFSGFNSTNRYRQIRGCVAAFKPSSLAVGLLSVYSGRFRSPEKVLWIVVDIRKAIMDFNSCPSPPQAADVFKRRMSIVFVVGLLGYQVSDIFRIVLKFWSASRKRRRDIRDNTVSWKSRSKVKYANQYRKNYLTVSCKCS